MTWDDARIETAYRGLATQARFDGVADSVAVAVREPTGAAGRIGPRPWRSWLAAAAAIVLIAVGVGVATIPHASVGPSRGGLNHFHAEGFDFDYPSSWAIHDQLPSSTGFGQTLAVIGTQPWPASCGASDINCYYEAKLEPGTIAVDIGVSYYPATDDDLCTRGATGTDLQGRGPDDPKATRTLARIDGRPALVTTYDVAGKDFYLSDEWLDWAIAPVGTVDQAFTISAKVRGPGTEALKADLAALLASVRLTPSQIAGGSGPVDCGAPFPTPDSAATASGSVSLKLATEPPPTPLPSGAAMACDQALLPVRIIHVGGSVKTVSPETGTEVAVAWPRGFSARLIGGIAEIVAVDGTVVGREGAIVVRLGGGLDASGSTFNICSVNGTIYLPAP